MSGGDHSTPTPGFRGPRIPILSKRGLPLYLARCGWRYFVTGREIASKGDNATFLHDATEDYRKRPYTKLTRARWRRVARRQAFIGVPAMLLTAEGLSRVVEFPYYVAGNAPPGWAEVPWLELLQGYAVGGPIAAGVVFVPRLKREWAERETRRDVIYPATQVACQILGQRWDKKIARSMLELPPGFGEPTEDDVQPSVRLYLPPVPLDKNTKARITSNVGARLGLPEATGEWQEFGGKAWVLLSGADVPPKRADLSAVCKLEEGESTTLRQAIERSELDRPVVGIASGGRIVHADLSVDPHIAISGATKTGKSTLLRTIYTQRMRHGSGLLVLDLKGVSHPFAYRVGSNRAVVAYKIEDIHEACVALGEELYRRRDESVAALQRGDKAPTFRTLDVVVEEANSLIPALNAYWTARRKEIQVENKARLEDDEWADVTEPPVRSPAVDALGFGIQMGRELFIHLAYAGQRLSAAAFGGQGGDRRESFGERYLARWQRQTWKMLVSGAAYRVPPSGPVGIWARVTGDKVDMIRVPFLSVDMAVDMINESPDPGQPVLPHLSFSSVSSGRARTIEGETVQVDRLAAVRGRRVSLRDAVDVLQVGTVETLRSARKQDDRFPEPVEIGGPGRADLFDLADLIEWQEGRSGRPLELG